MRKSKLSDLQNLQVLISAAQGKTPCDLVFKDVRYLDVFTCEWRRSDLGIKNGVIVSVDRGISGKREISARGKTLVPGFIDAHVHIESSLLRPDNFEEVVLSRGTTTAVCDPHELANVMGVPGIEYFLNAAEELNLDLRVMLSSCVPSTHLETNGAGTISAEDLLPFKSHSKALGLAEMMNVPGVLDGDPEVLKKLTSFSDQVIDGHCPLLTGKSLSAYALAGISTCHESSEKDEALEKLSKGISIWIREGSVAKDLQALIPLLNISTSTSMGFCTDDRNPYDIFKEGHIDHLVRSALATNIAPEVVYRAASWSVARHYGLDRNRNRKGAISPGYVADLVLLSDVRTCSIEKVLRAGCFSDELQNPRLSFPVKNTVHAKVPELSDLEGPQGRVHVITVEHGKILTGRTVKNHDAPGVAKLSVLGRHRSKMRAPANGYVLGFGDKLKGAIASSVGHDSHNLIAVGSNAADMRAALACLIELRGGFCVVQNEKVLASLALPLGGLMSDEGPQVICEALTKLKAASQTIGCFLPEPFLQLAFLSLPVIPSLKLTDRGLVDVEQFKLISVAV